IFRRIDDPDIEVNAEVIFMLAIDSNQGQLDTISKIMELIQDSKLIETITKADTTEIIETLVSHAFLNE
ncbi:MAG: PTS sugar transporter subunit IIA, partial [Bacillota bacterium]